MLAGRLYSAREREDSMRSNPQSDDLHERLQGLRSGIAMSI